MGNRHEQSGFQGIEVREEGGQGFFSGYITAWGTTDSYNSTFVKGSFKKTIEERGHRIKVLDNHDANKVIGKVTEIREDDHGVYVEGQLTMAVEKARDVFEHIRANVLDTLSFGFKTLSDKYVQGVRNITEVKLFEVSPVTFEANEAAMITDVREDENDEQRATDFNQTVEIKEINRGGWTLLAALETTLDDIWWESMDASEVREAMDKALADFHASYLEWVNKFLALYWEDVEERSMPSTNELRTVFASFVNGRSLESIAAESDFTASELRTLSKGKILSPAIHHKVASLPEEVRTAYHTERRSVVEALCTELRTSGFSQAEGNRFSALLYEPEVRSDKEPEAGLGNALATAAEKFTF